jgi:hypothetical protein
VARMVNHGMLGSTGRAREIHVRKSARKKVIEDIIVRVRARANGRRTARRSEC